MLLNKVPRTKGYFCAKSTNMGINNIGRFFMPKNKLFYELFEDVAEKAHEMGIKLKEMVSEADQDKRRAILAQIEDLEHKNDDNTHKIFTELGRNFITPFDREDILAVAIAYELFSQNTRILILDACCFEEESSKYGKSFLDHLAEVRKSFNELNSIICAENISSRDFESALTLTHISVEELKNTIEDVLLGNMNAAKNWKE